MPGSSVDGHGQLAACMRTGLRTNEKQKHVQWERAHRRAWVI